MQSHFADILVRYISRKEVGLSILMKGNPVLKIKDSSKPIYRIRYTYNASVGILGSVRECRGQGGGAALVIVRVLPGVDGGVDGDGPHGGRVPVTVAVVVLTSISGGPHIDVTQTVTALKSGRKNILRYFGRRAS